MKKLNINTSKKVVPMCYAYTTPEIARHHGWTKIGFTEQDVETRIRQQTQTADIKYKLEWMGTAIYDDGTGDTFRDQIFMHICKNMILNVEHIHIWMPMARNTLKKQSGFM